MNTKHALLSPSGAHRWLACAASVYHDSGADSSNEYSDEGTAAHALAAMSLTEGIPCHGYIGRRIEVEEGALRTVEVTEDMATDVQRYCDSIISYAGGMSAIGKTAFVEVSVPIGHLTGEKDAAGTADVVILVPGQRELQVHDLKFGRGVRVDPEHNEQLMMYALGALYVHDPLGEIERVRMVVHQVRLGPAREWDCDASTLRSFERRVRAAATRALVLRSTPARPSPRDYVPSEEACRWCEHKPHCAALQAHLEGVVGAEFEDLTKQVPPAVGRYEDDPSALAARMNVCSLLEDWIKAVRAEVEKRLFEGKPVPGWKIVQGKRGARDWTSEKEAEEMLRRQFRLPIEVAYNLKLKSPPQVEKLVKSGEVGPKQWEKLQPLVTQREGQPSVAPESDPRPAYTLPSAADFDDVSKAGLV